MISSSSSTSAPGLILSQCNRSLPPPLWLHRSPYARQPRPMLSASALLTPQQQHSSSEASHAALPHQQQQRRRRRHSSTAVQQQVPIGSYAVNLERLQEQQQQHHPTKLVLYIPVGFEAAAVEACRQAGYTLPQNLSAAPLSRRTSADVLGTAETANQKTATAAASTTARATDSFIVQEPQGAQGAGHAAMTKLCKQHQNQPQHPEPVMSQQTERTSINGQSPSMQQQQQQRPMPASPLSPEQAAAAESPPLAAWQLAVNKRVSSTATSLAPHTLSSSRSGPSTHLRSSSTSASRKVAMSRLSRHISNSSSSSSSRPGSPTASSAPALNRSSSSSSSVAVGGLAGLQPGQLAYGQRLSPEAEAELCSMYQRYLQLEADMKGALQHLNHQQQQQQHSRHAAAATGAASLPSDLAQADSIQAQGIMAQQLLLELYNPLVVTRANRAAKQAPSADLRELMAAARRGLLQAAAKFDASRTAGSSSSSSARLGLLADGYIRNALRNVLQEYQAGVVALPTHLLELRVKLQRLAGQHQQQHGSRPSTAALAAAAGVTLQQAERALQASALQASGLSEAGGGDDDADVAPGGGLNLLLLEVSVSVDDLDDAMAQGAVRASLSGLAEARDEAAQQALLASVMQQYLMALKPRDRSLLALRIGIELPETHGSTYASSSTNNQQASSGSWGVSAGGIAAGVTGDGAGDEQQGMSLEQLAQHFNVKSRQRAHQLMEAAVGQLRQRLQAAAGQDAQVAQLLGLAGSSGTEL